MPIKIKIFNTKPVAIAVKQRRPVWQQFLSY